MKNMGFSNLVIAAPGSPWNFEEAKRMAIAAADATVKSDESSS